MEHRAVLRQARLEHELLAHIIESLRATIEWQAEGGDFSRQLSTLQFLGRSFERHLKRIFDLEEIEGHLVFSAETHPHLHKETYGLKLEHDEIRRSLADILDRLDRGATSSQHGFQLLCGELSVLLKKTDEHNQREANLVRNALLFEQE